MIRGIPLFKFGPLRMEEKKRRGIFLAVLGLLWLGLVVYGFGLLLRYEMTPGKVSPKVPSQWPAASQLEKPSKQPVLLMMAHPECPCTRASLRELEKMVPRIKDQARIQVVFMKPEGFSEAQVRGSLWQKVQKMPGVQPLLDAANKEVENFRARISGETFLYGTDGKLLFHGGLTSARGHEGMNLGVRAVTELITTGKTQYPKTQSFGCPLLKESDQ